MIFFMQGVRDVMVARLDLAQEKGCDGVEPDNVQVSPECCPPAAFSGTRP